MTETEPSKAVPVDAVVERLNDPAVAAALVTLLDNAELLSTLVLGLGGVISRGELIMDAVAEGVNDFKASRGDAPAPQIPSLSEVSAITSELIAAGPALERVLNSKMVEADTIELLSTVSEAATEGVARARAEGTRVGGPISAVRAMRDDDVQRGLGVLIEISRALGRRLR
jgi:hypothetical protein